MRFRIGEIYRYARPADTSPSHVDGLPNFHYLVHSKGMPRIQMERGIAAPARTKGPDGHRVAAFFLSSNHHKRGTL